MKKAQLVLILCLLWFSSVSQSKVSVFYDGTFDFAAQQTYDFSLKTKKMVEKQFHNQPYFMTALIRKLNEKGYKQMEKNPDLIVDLKFSSNKSLELGKQPHTAYSKRRTPRNRSRQVRTVNKPTLTKETKAKWIIYIKDAGSNRTIWTGIWTGEPDPDVKPEKRKKRIDKVLKKMFKRFPKD